MVKLIAADLDGTLLNNGILSEDDAALLARVQANGTKLMVATGRNRSEVGDMVDRLQLRQYGGAIALADGQYLADFVDQSSVENGFLTYTDDLKHIRSLGLSGYGNVKAFSKSGNYLVVPSVFSTFYWKARIRSMIKRRNMNRVLYTGRDYQIDDIEKIVLDAEETEENFAKLSSRYEAFYVHDNHRYEMKRKGVNKGASVKAIQEKYGYLDDEVAVFGNDENDVSMFRHYANSFVVDSAPEAVKAKANHIIPQGKVAAAIAALALQGAQV